MMQQINTESLFTVDPKLVKKLNIKRKSIPLDIKSDFIKSITEFPTKEKKKKEDKKKKKEDDLEPNEQPTQFIGFSSTKEEPPSNDDELKPFFIEELPTDKDSLYQELIALEGKRYSIEKNYKELEKKFSTGSINEADFKKQNDELKIKSDEITSRINKIRRVISSI